MPIVALASPDAQAPAGSLRDPLEESKGIDVLRVDLTVTNLMVVATVRRADATAGGYSMTEQKHLKALIRSRMARTGESYTTARSHIVRPQEHPNLTATAEFRAHDKHCMTALFTPDDTNVVSGGFGGQARIWTLDGTRPASSSDTRPRSP